MKLRQTDDRDMLLGIVEIPSLLCILGNMKHDIYYSSITYVSIALFTLMIILMAFLSWPFKKVNFQHALCGSLFICKHSFQPTKPFFWKRCKVLLLFPQIGSCPATKKQLLIHLTFLTHTAVLLLDMWNHYHDQPSLVLHSQSPFFLFPPLPSLFLVFTPALFQDSATARATIT